ncbi:MAG: VOC family protein, partial [Dehalococcoidia bacterium]|nr:VOC family protein [Dehalococcoidia bacterium]
MAATAPAAHSPLALSVISSARLDESLRFYRDHIGLTPSPPMVWSGSAFEAIWGLPPGATATATLLSAAGSTVGRVLLVQFDAPDRELIRARGERRFYGLANLNFYCFDIHAQAQRLTAAGYPTWTAPTAHTISATVGTPTEVLLEGPDGVVINLVQLAEGDHTRIGEMLRYLRARGTTPTGFTEVVTSAHCVRERAAPLAFYQRVLGMEILIDEVLSRPENNGFLSLPPDAQTAVVFLKGAHLFGKVCLSIPLNYHAPDLGDRARAPNIGYLAMAFDVPDLAIAARACMETNAEIFCPPR